MKTHNFTFEILNRKVITDKLADRVYESCNDCTLSSTRGRAYMEFDREAKTRKEAIASAREAAAKINLKIRLTSPCNGILKGKKIDARRSGAT